MPTWNCVASYRWKWSAMTEATAAVSFSPVGMWRNSFGPCALLAGPSTPVEIVGLSEVPTAGDKLYVAADLRKAQEVAEQIKALTKRPVEMAGQNIAVNWRKLFGRNYKQAEAQIVMCKGYFKTNPTAWFNATDSFIDWLWVGLFAADPSLGTYQIGNVGGISSSARLRAKHPALHKLLNLVHGKRLESHLSHAVTKATQRPTRTIPFRWLSHGAVALRRAAIELLKLGY